MLHAGITVRSSEQRRPLDDMDMQLVHLRQTLGEPEPPGFGLTGTYRNLLRIWADVQSRIFPQTAMKDPT